MVNTEDAPKLFISYSWSSEMHETWVLRLATELRGCGVDVILDKWDLREGQDAYKFMEQMVTDASITKVAIICDKNYAEKADVRSGGVGVETQIITPEIYNSTTEKKFVAIIAERNEDGTPCLPNYYKSRIYIDLSDADRFAVNFEQLVRWVYDKPRLVKPPVGTRPSFLDDDSSDVATNTFGYFRAKKAIETDPDRSRPAIEDYLATVAESIANIEVVRPKDEAPYDDIVVESIDRFLPMRDEYLTLIQTAARAQLASSQWMVFHRFLETMLNFTGPIHGTTQWRESDYDIFRFIAHELFLSTIAILLERELFEEIQLLLGQPYYLERRAELGREPTKPFSIFYSSIQSFGDRNRRLDLRRVSLHADLLKDRATENNLRFQELMQADFLLFLRDSAEALRDGRSQRWMPVTLVYGERQHGPFRIFARCKSRSYFKRLIPALGLTDKEGLDAVIRAFVEGELLVPSWELNSVDPKHLIGLDAIGSIP